MSNINIEMSLTAHNTFTLKKYDATDELVQEVSAHNTVCDAFLFSGSMHGGYLNIGSGTGTPAPTDTDLFNYWYETTHIEGSKVITINDNRICVHTRYELPASYSCVGTITELGIRTNEHKYTGSLINHSVLVNSEGSPISIEKTELDKVIIELDFFIDLIYPANMIPVEPAYNIFYKTLKYTSSTPRIGVALATSIEDATYLNGYGSYTSSPSSACHLGYMSIEKGTRVYTLKNARIPTELVDMNNSPNIYFKALQLEGIGSIPLIDSDIFNHYSLPKVQIGIGDDITMQFKNPYEYFVENTDKIYLNGRQLTRSVDYSIDYKNNASRLAELSEACEAKVLGSKYYYPGKGSFTYSFLGYASPFVRCVTNAIEHVGTTVRTIDYLYCPVLEKDKPMILDMGKAVTFNTFSIPGRIANARYNKIYLDYSTDGEDYTHIGEIVCDSTGVDKETSTSKILSFEDITARYWRLRTETVVTYMSEVVLKPALNFSQSGSSSSDTRRKSELAFKCADNSYDCFLGYVGDGFIRFTTPPPEGAIIELEVDMDRPFKNSNWVIDISIELSL